MSDPSQTTLRLSGENAKQSFALVPDAAERATLARDLGVIGIKKLRFEGTVSPDGARDWRLDGTLGATVVQSCVVTLEPVSTRLDGPVTRRYVTEMPDVEDASEVEMPEDDSLEPLPETLNLSIVMAEALALALPDFPRADDAEPVEISVTEPGKTAMTDDDAKPFAGLAGLRESLEEKSEKDD